MRRSARVDANQVEIVEALRRAGAFVQSLHTIGKGCPDLLVAFRGSWHVLEVKDGKKLPSDQALTKPELRWILAAEKCAPVHVVNSVEQALKAIGAIK